MNGLQIQHFVPHPQQSKGLQKTGLQEWHNISNQKVGEWIATHLQQMDGLQIQHFVPHLAIKRWQSRRKIYGLINIMQITLLIL